MKRGWRAVWLVGSLLATIWLFVIGDLMTPGTWERILVKILGTAITAYVWLVKPSTKVFGRSEVPAPPVIGRPEPGPQGITRSGWLVLVLVALAILAYVLLTSS